ncbi:PAS domain-containing protein, partial [Streptomyces toxytricini]|uniref:PAS domain-containing protein n=1 Tax=Streptomyces toxytricini TaxID=67369 RepID=UPI003412B6D5
MNGTAGYGGLHGPLDVSRAAVAVLDGEGRVVGWSPAAADLLGYTPAEVLGRGFDSLAADPAAPPLTPGARAVLRLRHRDGGPGRRTAVAVHPLTCADEDRPGPAAGQQPARLLAMADADAADHWDALQSMLHGLATQSPIGLAIYGTDLRVVWTNAALEKEMGPADYSGIGPDDMVAGGAVISPGMPGTLEEVMARVLATGGPVTDLHYKGRPPSAPDRDHVWSCSYYRLEGPGGAPLGVCEETFDITDRYLAQQRLDLLVRAARRVGTTLDMGRTAHEFANVTTPEFADAVTVDVTEAVLRGERPRPDTAADTASVRLWPPEHPGAPAAADPSGPGTLTVPLRIEGTELGRVTFAWRQRTGPFDPGELAVAGELAARLAVCVDNARRYTREHAAALEEERGG